jgi:hypothetical protein
MATQNNLQLTGLQPLPYSEIPAQLFLELKDPTSANYNTLPYKNFSVGTFWLNTTNQKLWYLASIANSPKVQGNWVLLSSGMTNTETITGNSGGAVGPNLSSNINFVGDGTTITIVGSPSTNTLTASLITPVTVPNGGTGDISFTAYAPIVGGITTTGVLQSAATGISNSGYVLTSTGASSLPTWQAAAVTGITTLDADSGSATGSTVTISGGSTGLTTIASAATMDLTGTLIVANGGTGDATFTANELIASGTTSTGAFQQITNGSAGQVLTANASGLPSFKNSSGGAWTLLQTQNASNSASITFDSTLITATYNNYVLVITGALSVVDLPNMLLQFSTNNGSSYLTGSYVYGINSWAWNTNAAVNGSASSAAAIVIGSLRDPSAAVGPFNGTYWFYNMVSGASSTFPYVMGDYVGTDNLANTARALTIGTWQAPLVVNNFQITMASGNISSGTFSLYGISQ